MSCGQDRPVSKLGPWVVIGWASAFRETDVASDFAATLKGWADQDDNKQLKAAAAVAMKLSSKRKRPGWERLADSAAPQTGWFRAGSTRPPRRPRPRPPMPGRTTQTATGKTEGA